MTVLSSAVEKLVQQNRELQRRVERLETREGMTLSAKPTSAAIVMSAFFAIPGLVGLWPQGFVNGATAGSVVDLTGNQGDMANTTDVNWTRGGTDIDPPNAYVSYGNTGAHYFVGKNLAQFQIIGNESFNATASLGLTIGGWFLPTNNGTFSFMMSKWETTTLSKAYSLVHTTDNVEFLIYSGGNHLIIGTGDKFTNSSGFHFCVGRFQPGAELKVWRNRETAVNTTSIPTTIANGTGKIAIAARGDGTNKFGGRGGICFVSNQYVEDGFIDQLYAASRGYYRPTVED